MPGKKTTAEKEVKEKTAKKNTAEKAAPVVEAQEKAAPAAETAPVIEKAAPVAEKAAPVAEKAAPVAEKAAPVAEKAVPVAEKAAPVVEKKAPAEKKTPAHKKAIKKEAAPAEEKPAEKKKAPARKKSAKKTADPVEAALTAVLASVAEEAAAEKTVKKAGKALKSAAEDAMAEEAVKEIGKAVQSAAEEAAAEKAMKEVGKALKSAAEDTMAEEAVKEVGKAVQSAIEEAAAEDAASALVESVVEEATAAVVEEAVTDAVVEETAAAAVEEAVTDAVVEEAAGAVVEEAATNAVVEEAANAAVEEAVTEAAVEEATAAAVEEAVVEAAAEEAPAAEEVVKEEPVMDEPVVELPQPRRSVAFIGSECYPFIKTGGLGDVMYALPRALTKQNCDVKVILPRYACIPQKYQEKMVYRGEFQMDLCADGRSFYVGIMEYVWDGVVYDFIDNNDFFSWGNPYTDLVRDIPKYCYFAKAALAALNYMDWIPDIIHCHDWQAALVPVYLRTLFADSPVGRAKSMITIHNLRFQGIYNIPTLRYWTGLPGYVFDYGHLKQGYEDANMLKGGLAYADMITTVSNTYAWEIQTGFYGEGLDAHLRFHSGKLRGIVNGIDVDIWNSATDKLLAEPYDAANAVEKKKANKLALQAALGLEQNTDKMVIGLISRLTDQKGLDLVNAVFQQFIDGNTQVVVLGTGERRYEDAFRYYENTNRGTVCSYISYNEGLAHQIYAGADALLVPSLFEPCGLTQLIAMRYGTIPVVRETGGLKDTVQPYNQFTNEGNGFTFDRYEAGLLLDAVNRAKTVYFTDRTRWDEMVQRDMEKDVSWENSAKQYRDLYLQLRP